MAIQVECPSCGKLYRLSDQLAGKNVKCKECGSLMEVPGGPAPLATVAPPVVAPKVPTDPIEAAAAAALSPDAAALAIRPRRNWTGWIIGGVLFSGLFLVALLCGGLLPMAGVAIGVLFLVAAACLLLVGHCWGLALAFRENVGQGVMFLVIPFYNLYYAISRWHTMRPAFMTTVMGTVVGTAAIILAVVGGSGGLGGLAGGLFPEPAIKPGPPGPDPQPGIGPPVDPFGPGNAGGPDAPPVRPGGGLRLNGGNVIPPPPPAADQPPGANQPGARFVADVWDVDVDPWRNPFQVPADLPLSVPVTFGSRFIAPRSPSPFLCVGANGGDSDAREVWDLRTGKRAGILRGKADLGDPVVLSADGKRLAGKGERLTVSVWSVETGQRMGELDVPGVSDLRFLEFAGNNQIVTVGRTNQDRTVIHTWDAESGERLKQVDGPDSFDPGLTALSAGGQNLAMMAREGSDVELWVVDLQAGKLAAKARWSAGPRARQAPKGLAFSHDGKELAVLFTAWPENQGTLLSVRVADGTTVVHHVVEQDLNSRASHEGLALQWLPDGSGWLVGEEYVMDHDTGKELLRPVAEESRFGRQNRRLIGTSVLYVSDKRGAFDSALVAVSVSADRINRVRTALGGGGTAADSDLPSLTDADWGGAEEIRAAALLGWAAAPDVGLPDSGEDRRLVALDLPAERLGPIRFSGPAAGQLVAGTRLDGDKDGTASGGVGEMRTLFRYTLSDGKRIGTLDVPAVCQLADVSPSGKFILTQVVNDPRRLDVWSAEAGTHMAGFRPYQREVGDKQSVVWSAFLDDSRLLSMSSDGQLTLWEIPTFKAHYNCSTGGRLKVRLSPSLKYVVVGSTDSVRFFDAATGQIKGTLDLKPLCGGQPVQNLEWAFRPDGGELAVVLTAAAPRIGRFDLKTGQVIDQIPLPVDCTSHLAFSGREYLVAGDGWLIDLTRRMVVWYYGDGFPVSPVVYPDGRFWFSGGRSSTQGATLVGLRLPEEGAAPRISAALAPGATVLMGPGSKIRPNVIGGPAGDLEFSNRVIAGLEANLKERGFIVNADQGQQLTIQGSLLPTGETVDYEPLGAGAFGGETIRIATTRLDASASLVDSRGQIIWNQSVSLAMPPPHIVQGEQADIVARLNHEQWMSFEAWASNLFIPSLVAMEQGQTVSLPGRSSLFNLLPEQGRAVAVNDSSSRPAPAAGAGNGGTRPKNSAPEGEVPRLRPVAMSPAHPTDRGECMAFNPVAPYPLVIGAGGDIVICDPAGQELIELIKDVFRGWIKEIVVSPDGKSMAFTGNDPVVPVLATAKLIPRRRVQALLRGHTADVTCLAFSSGEGKWIATGSTDKSVRIWNRADGNPVTILDRHSQEVTALAFSPDGRSMATAAKDDEVLIWDTTSWQVKETLRSGNLDMTAIGFSPDSHWFAASTSRDQILIFDTSTWQEISTIPTSAGRSIAFSPDSKWIAATGSFFKRGAGIWEVETARKVFSLEGHAGDVTEVAFSPDGKILVSIGDDRNLAVYDLDGTAGGGADPPGGGTDGSQNPPP